MARNFGHQLRTLFSCGIHEVATSSSKFKMATALENTKRNKHSLGFFCDLHAFSKADFCFPSKKRRKALEGSKLFSVERVVASRTSKEVSLLFLCKKYAYRYQTSQLCREVKSETG